jgi:hypothetical protein
VFLPPAHTHGHAREVVDADLVVGCEVQKMQKVNWRKLAKVGESEWKRVEASGSEWKRVEASGSE